MPMVQLGFHYDARFLDLGELFKYSGPLAQLLFPLRFVDLQVVTRLDDRHRFFLREIGDLIPPDLVLHEGALSS